LYRRSRTDTCRIAGGFEARIGLLAGLGNIKLVISYVNPNPLIGLVQGKPIKVLTFAIAEAVLDNHLPVSRPDFA
jgi:hypothetical protein